MIPYKFLTVIFFTIASSNAFSKDSLCHSEEKVFFSCEIGRKIVSICERKKSPRFLEYRFGAKNKIEMTYKATDDENSKFKKTEVLYSSNSSSLIWFGINQYRYILNLPMKGGPVLEVKNGGRTISEMPCKQGWEGSIGEPEAKSDFIITLPDTSPSDVEKLISN